jgi:ubiquitin carboxyl-terminal hydrolase 34
MSDVYLRNAVQCIDKALLNTVLIDSSLSNPHELQLAAVLVSILLEFLRGMFNDIVYVKVATFLPEAERPGPEMSANYFSDSAALVDRLIKIISVTLQGPNLSMAAMAQDAYATILEASLHSEDVWRAFTSHADSQRVHFVLLLAQPIVSVREHVSRKITSICGGDLPSTSPVKQRDTATHFWTVISAILPEADRYAGQSQQLFELAEHVFRAQDEHNRDEGYLRSLLAQWGALLLQHDHHEFPGREQIDHFVLGLTKLLLCCVLSIKSFKKPVNAGSLMAQAFKKYLFVTRYVE